MLSLNPGNELLFKKYFLKLNCKCLAVLPPPYLPLATRLHWCGAARSRLAWSTAASACHGCSRFGEPAMGISLTISSINCHFPPIYLFCDIFLPSPSLSLSTISFSGFSFIVIVVACLYISWLCSSNCNNGVKCFTADKKFNLCENMFWPHTDPPFFHVHPPAQLVSLELPDGQINRYLYIWLHDYVAHGTYANCC